MYDGSLSMTPVLASGTGQTGGEVQVARYLWVLVSWQWEEADADHDSRNTRQAQPQIGTKLPNHCRNGRH